jgi:DNA-binding GntR family transcriptional regulator
VRETLLRLTLEGVIAADAGYGFEVKPLDRVDIEQSYPILWTLEGLALRLSPVPTAEHLKTLAVLNARMRKTTDPAELIAVDHKWHALLTSGCPNGRLLDMIASQKKGLRRYEFAYMRAAGDTDESTRYHVAIITALRSRSVRQAIRALEESWRMGMMRLLVWLETTSADRAGSE